MLINEVVYRYNAALNEASNMSNNEWVKPGSNPGEFKYADPFIEKLLSNEPFEVTAKIGAGKNKEDVEGFIIPSKLNKIVAAQIQEILKLSILGSEVSWIPKKFQK